jgi:hypothetical protein
LAWASRRGSTPYCDPAGASRPAGARTNVAGATILESPPDYDPARASRPTGAINNSRPFRGKADAYDGASRPTRGESIDGCAA